MIAAVGLVAETVYLIKRYAEFVPKSQKKLVPSGTRGIYVLLKRGWTKERGKTENTFRVIYVGMSDGHVHGRLNSHARSKRKRDAWDYFSVFEVWENIPEQQIRDLEGLFRHIYRKDPDANTFNVLGGFNKLKPWKVPIERWREGKR